MNETRYWRETIEAITSDNQFITSASATAFLSGEKAIRFGATATCIKIPFRVYVGIRSTSGADGTISLGKNLIVTNSGIKKFNGTTRTINDALKCATNAVHAITGENIKKNLIIDVLSDWKGNSGLGWSGSFSVSLASALFLYVGLIDLGQRPRREDILKPNSTMASKMVKVAWLIESVLHGGRSSGSAILGSMADTALPYHYRCKDSDMPVLFRVDADTDDRKRIVGDIGILKECSEKFTYELDLLASQAEEDTVLSNLLTVLDIGLINSGTSKSTAVSAKRELTSGGSEIISNKDLISKYFNCDEKCFYAPLVAVCDELAYQYRQLIVLLSVGDTSEEKLESTCSKIVNLTTRNQGMLVALDFGFDVGDAIIGMITSRGGRQLDSIGAKLSGGGHGGYVLFVGYLLKQLSSVGQSVASKLSKSSNEKVEVDWSLSEDKVDCIGLTYIEQKSKGVFDGIFTINERIKLPGGIVNLDGKQLVDNLVSRFR